MLNTVKAKTLRSSHIFLYLEQYPIYFYLASVIIYIILYVSFINNINQDYIIWLQPWHGQIQAGGFASLKYDFYNYAPAYMYLIYLATLLPVQAVISIKLLALPIVPVAGYYLAHLSTIIRPRTSKLEWLAFTATVLTPTILLNSAYWGQADVFYGTACLACVVYLIDKQPISAMTAFGVAIAFKAQAIFLAPFIIVMLIKRQLPWRLVVIPPTVWVLSVAPVVFVGKPIEDVILMYLRQADTYHALCMNCTNLWSMFPTIDYGMGVAIGILSALSASGAYVWFMVTHLSIHNRHQIFIAALISVMVVPFFLPKMHDRYFYVAELFSVGLLLFHWQDLLIPLLLQVSTGNVYWQYLLRKGFLYPQFESGILNVIVIGLLIQLFIKIERQKPIDQTPLGEVPRSDSSE